mgnify:CR=1 FL=1
MRSEYRYGETPNGDTHVQQPLLIVKYLSQKDISHWLETNWAEYLEGKGRQLG